MLLVVGAQMSDGRLAALHGNYCDSKQKISYRNIRRTIGIHDIIIISHRPSENKCKVKY